MSPHSRKISGRKRLRELGIVIGRYKPGKLNAITDVPGVMVGHSTIISGRGGHGKTGPARTGVTAILPNGGNVYNERVVGGSFVLNGAGEMAGLTQVVEWGLLETPILLTNTLAVGTCSESLVNYMIENHPEIGRTEDVVIPLVGECDDSWLNDITARHVGYEHVLEALQSASSGPVSEGSVGGGTGMLTCDFKAGIGTSSRKLPEVMGGYTIGVLVMSNFGVMENLRVDGLPVGEILAPKYAAQRKRGHENYGSIIAVLATTAPLLPHQLTRLSKRVALGIGRTGSYAANGSGEIILAFSTANKVPRRSEKMVYRMKILLDKRMDALYEAAIEATEEAILNALCAADPMEGVNGNYAPALPLDELKDVFEQYRKLLPARHERSKAPGT
ncbi:MAG: peptidase S58 [Spirochaetes bacterium GWB1_66_5]|nr:MAG: peptidase S58 [Spirochaetes bacterium GWB1_66_5]